MGVVVSRAAIDALDAGDKYARALAEWAQSLRSWHAEFETWDGQVDLRPPPSVPKSSKWSTKDAALMVQREAAQAEAAAFLGPLRVKWEARNARRKTERKIEAQLSRRARKRPASGGSGVLGSDVVSGNEPAAMGGTLPATTRAEKERERGSKRLDLNSSPQSFVSVLNHLSRPQSPPRPRPTPLCRIVAHCAHGRFEWSRCRCRRRAWRKAAADVFDEEEAQELASLQQRD